MMEQLEYEGVLCVCVYFKEIQVHAFAHFMTLYV